MENSLELNSELDSVSSGPLLFIPGATGLGSGHKWVVVAQFGKVILRPYNMQGEEKFTTQGSEAHMGLPLKGTIGDRKIFNSQFQVFL